MGASQWMLCNYLDVSRVLLSVWKVIPACIVHRSAAGPAILWSSLFCGTKATKGASKIFREIRVVVTDFSIYLRPGFCLVSGMSCLSPDDQMPLCRFVIICWNIHRGEREGCVVCAGLFFRLVLDSSWFNSRYHWVLKSMVQGWCY